MFRHFVCALIAGGLWLAACKSTPAAPTAVPPVRLHTTLSAQPFAQAATDRAMTGALPFAFTVAPSHGALLQSVANEDVIGITLYMPPGVNLWAAPIADEAIAIIVHPSVTLNDVSLQQLENIFTGRAQDSGWAVAVREDGDDSRAAFEAMALRGVQPTLNAVLSPTPQAMLAFVAQTPNAIGYLPTRWVDGTIKILSVEGIAPGDPAYSLRLTVLAVANAEPKGLARDWLAKVQAAGLNP